MAEKGETDLFDQINFGSIYQLKKPEMTKNLVPFFVEFLSRPEMSVIHSAPITSTRQRIR